MMQEKLSQKIGNKTRFYYSETYKQEECKKFVLDGPTVTALLAAEEKKVSKQLAEQAGLKLIFKLQFDIDNEFIVKNIYEKYSEKQLHIYQQDFDCFLADLNLSSLSFEKRFKIFQCVALGVKYLSNNLICHRFLSPAHISIISIGKNDYVAKINNFDYAQQLQSKRSLTSSNVQKNQYSAPEIKHGKPHGLAADVWSLGAILNYLLYGTIDNIWEDEGVIKIEVLQNTPDWLLECLRSMLHYNPGKRSSIGSVIEIVKSSLKCLNTLTKYIPIASGEIKFCKIESKLKAEEKQFF